MAGDSVRATTVINASAEAIFAVLADPAQHAAIDGTGWVRETPDSKPLTGAGQIFRMSMYQPNHPNGHYEMANRVQTFDPPSTISWTPGYDGDDGTLRFGGRTWRYDLTPAGPSKPRSLSATTGRQSRTPSDSTSDSRRSLRSIWATRSPTSPNWLPHDAATHRP
ncbi:MAG: polyketide cyclase [Acidimicrobiales bacterium]